MKRARRAISWRAPARRLWARRASCASDIHLDVATGIWRRRPGWRRTAPHARSRSSPATSPRGAGDPQTTVSPGTTARWSAPISSSSCSRARLAPEQVQLAHFLSSVRDAGHGVPELDRRLLAGYAATRRGGGEACGAFLAYGRSTPNGSPHPARQYERRPEIGEGAQKPPPRHGSWRSWRSGGGSAKKWSMDLFRSPRHPHASHAFQPGARPASASTAIASPRTRCSALLAARDLF